MADWWNTSYSVRRNVKFTPSADLQINTGYPLTVSLNHNTLVNSNKLRPDFADLEVVYWNGTTNTVIPRSTSVVGEDLIIQFNAEANITTENSNYFIYMANPSLYERPTVSEYIPSDYVIDTSATGGVGLSFTKPTEEWIEGTSQAAGAKATFSFFGINARLIVEKGPDKGVLELIVDSQPKQLIDCYSSTISEQVVYTTSGLTLSRHNIRMTVTGDKNQASSGISVRIVKFEYSKYVLATDLGEELNPALSARRIYVGP